MIGENGENEKELAAGCVSYFSPDGKHILYSERLLGTVIQDDFSVALRAIVNVCVSMFMGSGPFTQPGLGV